MRGQRYPRSTRRAISRRPSGLAGSHATRGAATLAVSFIIWESIWFASGGVGFAHSWVVIEFLARGLSSLVLWEALLVTVLLTLLGLLLGLVVAVSIGLVIGPSGFIEKSVRGSLYFARAIPGVALIPLLLASLGSRVGIVIVLVTWLVAIKLVLFVIRGVRDFDAGFEEQAQLLGLSPVIRAVFLRIPAASAQLVTGLRLTFNRAYGAVILGGLLAGTPGLGQLIQLARLNGDSTAVLGFAVLSGLVGVLLFWAFGALERYFVRWRPAE
jgi:ABC-type nitrate/sulfonate/bicarbonate transport system permease component